VVLSIIFRSVVFDDDDDDDDDDEIGDLNILTNRRKLLFFNTKNDSFSLL